MDLTDAYFLNWRQNVPTSDQTCEALIRRAGTSHLTSVISDIPSFGAVSRDLLGKGLGWAMLRGTE